MATRKGQGNKKGKQPARNHPAPQLSPPQSTSDEESWPIWQQLQDKMAAFKAARIAKRTPQPSEVQLHWSARDSKSHRRAKLKALAENLMHMFTVFEAEQQAEGAAKNEVNRATIVATHMGPD